MILTGKQIIDAGIITNPQPKFKMRCPYRGFDTPDIIELSGGADYSGYGLTLGESVVLAAGEYKLAYTSERITVPTHYDAGLLGVCSVVGFTCNKSTWARLGLIQPNTDMEAGWSGHLTLELYNASKETLYLPRGIPIATARFMLTYGVVEPYNGKYQNQPAKPVEAK